jgi:hypothetical protein
MPHKTADSEKHNEPGTNSYFGSPHPWMTGVVFVELIYGWAMGERWFCGR